MKFKCVSDNNILKSIRQRWGLIRAELWVIKRNLNLGNLPNDSPANRPRCKSAAVCASYKRAKKSGPLLSPNPIMIRLEITSGPLFLITENQLTSKYV